MLGIMARYKYRAPPELYKPLSEIVTAAEAARLYCRDRKSIIYAIDAGSLAARRIGRDWLIVRASLTALWGSPVNLPLDG